MLGGVQGDRRDRLALVLDLVAPDGLIAAVDLLLKSGKPASVRTPAALPGSARASQRTERRHGAERPLISKPNEPGLIQTEIRHGIRQAG